METKLYVGNLSYDTTEEDLSTLFTQAGKVESVDLIKDRASGRSKGFAFIVMSNQSELEKAIQMFRTCDHPFNLKFDFYVISMPLFSS